MQIKQHSIIHYIFTQPSKIKVLLKEKTAFRISTISVRTMSMGILLLFSHAEARGTEQTWRSKESHVGVSVT